MEFLQALGCTMSDTAEFNIYGAYKLDFTAIKSINIYKYKDSRITYTLELKQFVEQLQAGNIAALEKAIKNIPSLFTSYRFIDYLLIKNVHSADIVKKLEVLRSKEHQKPPAWLTLYSERIKAITSVPTSISASASASSSSYISSSGSVGGAEQISVPWPTITPRI